MSEEVTVRPEHMRLLHLLQRRSHEVGSGLTRIARAFARTDVPFEMFFPDGGSRRFGQGAPSFASG